jgi:carboxyl-terminal processing protease
MRLLAALLLLQPPTAPGWRVAGTPPDAYVVDTAGTATAPAGATVSLRARAGEARPIPASSGVFAVIPADTLRRRRVRVRGEIRTRDARAGASLWMRVDGPNGTLLLIDTGMDDPVRCTADWTAREVTLPVPAEADSVMFGLLLRDGLEAAARGLRVEVLPAPAAGVEPAPAARAVLDSALALARRYALWRDTVTWGVVEPRVRELAAGARSSREAYPAVWYLLSRLGDRHSFMQTPNVAASWDAGRATNPAPQARALPEGVGYVSVPAYSGGDSTGVRAYAERMHAALAGVAPAARCGWVVDLRPNAGGNMFPMLAGLKPFLGGGQLGRFWVPGGEGGAGTLVEPWVAGREVGVEPPPSLAALEQAPVAVLTGPRTASSGEVVTLAFRGRPRTRSFGAPTAGLTTGNERYLLPDGAAILLTVSVYVDRTGTRYGGRVAPDSLVGPATAASPVPPAGSPDPALDAAAAWLRAAPGCAATR